MALNKAQLQLLRLLKDGDSEHGMFFARWEEIRSSNYSEKWVNDHKDAPDLSWEAERNLLHLIEQGLVDELEKWGTREGKHYRIRPQGVVLLEEPEISATFRILQSVRRPLLWIILPLVAAWLLFLFGPDLGIFEFFGEADAETSG